MGKAFVPRSVQTVGGGCINTGYRVSDGSTSFFVKLNRRALADMFAAEAAGLDALASTRAIRVPSPICHGEADDHAFLAMEWVDLGSGSATADRRLGRQLADLHRIRQPYFGWQRDNTIGSTPQCNDRADDWIEFWRQRRLGFQLELAKQQGGAATLVREGEQLLARLDGLFDGYRPQPSLLHGDLWGGNAGCEQSGLPVVFDPACYYGDREADLAMTELFGGFSGDFCAAYQEALPLDPGYGVRKQLYNLYHILNHFHLFGGGYRTQAEAMIGRLLAELR